MADDKTVKLVPCPECKGQPKKDCKLCGGAGVIDPNAPKKQ